MHHVRPISLMPCRAQDEGALTVPEIAILAIVTVFFNGWDNFAGVIQNLQKFYQKTPA